MWPDSLAAPVAGLTFVASGLWLLAVSARTPGGLIPDDADVDLFKTRPRRGYRRDAFNYEDLKNALRRSIALEFHAAAAIG